MPGIYCLRKEMYVCVYVRTHSHTHTHFFTALSSFVVPILFI